MRNLTLGKIPVRKGGKSGSWIHHRVGTGPAVRLRSGRTRPDETRFFAGFLPDFCQCDVKNEPDGFYRFFSIFSPDFLPDFCRIFAGLTSKMIRPDFDRTGPDKF
jgi:hypothetical protein